MAMEREPLCALSAGELESVTWKMRPVKLPVVAGVPVMEPEVASERP